MFMVLRLHEYLDFGKHKNLEDAIDTAMSCDDKHLYIVEVRGSVVKRYEEYRRGLTGEINE